MSHLPETCTDVLASLPLYVGGDLDAPETEAVRRHLEGCAACLAEDERAREARRAMAAMAPAGTPAGAPDGTREPDLWPGIRTRLVASGVLEGGRKEEVASMATLSSVPADGTREAPRRGVLLSWKGWGAAAAAAALIGVAFLRGPEEAGPGAIPAGGGPLDTVVEAPATHDGVPGSVAPVLLGTGVGGATEMRVAADLGGLAPVPLGESLIEAARRRAAEQGPGIPIYGLPQPVRQQGGVGQPASWQLSGNVR